MGSHYLFFKKIFNKVYFANNFGVDYSMGFAKIDVTKIYKTLSLGYTPALYFSLSERFKFYLSIGGLFYLRFTEIPDKENKDYKYVDHMADLQFNATNLKIELNYVLK